MSLLLSIEIEGSTFEEPESCLVSSKIFIELIFVEKALIVNQSSPSTMSSITPASKHI